MKRDGQLDTQDEQWHRDPRLTEFMHACCDDRTRAEEMLRETPEILDCPGATVSGETPLHWLAVENECEAVKFLIEHGAQVDAPTDTQDTALGSAASLGYEDMVTILLEAGADPNAGGMWYRSPLHGWVTSEQPNLRIAAMLLDHGANLEAIDVAGWTPLMRAAEDGKLDSVQFLLDRGSNAKANSELGGTALHIVAESDHSRPDMVELLLKAGADPSARNWNGQTPYEVAGAKGNQAISEVLRRVTGEQ